MKKLFCAQEVPEGEQMVIEGEAPQGKMVNATRSTTPQISPFTMIKQLWKTPPDVRKVRFYRKLGFHENTVLTSTYELSFCHRFFVFPENTYKPPISFSRFVRSLSVFRSYTVTFV